MLLKVDGMTCGHCVAAVTRAVQAVDAAAEVAVAPEMDRVEVRTTAAPAAITEAVAEAGYPAEVVG